MPYPSRDSLPDSVKELPPHAQDIWMRAFNEAFHLNGDDVKSIKMAWGAVKNAGYEEEGEGNWTLNAAVKDDAKKAQEARSKKYGIPVQKGGNVSKPSEWSSVPDEEWGDPVNYKYPCPNAEQTAAALRYWGKPKNKDMYDEGGSGVVTKRLEEFKKKFKIGDTKSSIKTLDLKLKSSGQGEDVGYQWDVCIVKTGRDANGQFWTESALKASVEIFEGTQVFMLKEAQHSSNHEFGKPTGEIIGWLSAVQYQNDGLYGKLNILKSANGNELRQMLISSFEKNPTMMGLSVDVAGQAVADEEGVTVLTIAKATVDVVYDPAAGGAFMRMAAANKQSGGGVKMDLDELIKLLKEKKPHIYAANKARIDEKKIEVKDVIEWLDDGNAPLIKVQLAELQKLTCSIRLENILKLAELPEVVTEKLRVQYKDKVFVEDELKAVVKAEKDVLDKLMKTAGFLPGTIKVGQDDVDARAKMFDDFFDGKVKSIKAAYINATGDEAVSGQLKNMRRITASMDSTTLSNMLGDSITRKMLAEYKTNAYNKDWRKICNVVPIPDFRSNRRNRMGGYGNLPIVGQGIAFAALSSPSDEEATYSVVKRGGTEDITMEMIKNDDVGAVKRIPIKLATSAARTLYEFVFDFLATNPNIYDGTALFTVGHGNYATTAIDLSNLSARRRAMLKQTELNSGKRLGIPAKFVIVPIDLDKTVYDLVSAPRNSDFDPIVPEYTRTLQMEMIVVSYWTDTNNWFLAASPMDIPGLEIGFLDGREEPELYVQDQPTVGMVFTNDKITYKIRHIYGGSVTDFRAFDGSIVP